ncbi:SusF/SusE family outer membrane protein [Neiella sp. HB171785]|uniref:SusF/SusE family outer membrane protein n=1 Tax=Neiella litorisoli TaxID=2771431 RepID=A0A8J6QGX4_9GAMM|nr:SusF/SusE family outer membrane protein [Neiella litorisoli]MBD1389694.1 SusF/SusE family outer membrane protein [Neiella litorisoli]
MFKKILVASLAASALLSGCSSTADGGSAAVKPLSDYFFVRGDFNGWNADPKHKVQPTDQASVYMATIPLSAGDTLGFKFADDLWSSGANCGFNKSEDETIVLGKAVQVNCNSSYSNFKIEVKQTGNYNFYIDDSKKPREIWVELAK